MKTTATIASSREEYENQPALLRELSKSGAIESQVEEVPQDCSVLVGAGDSYAAALCASFLTAKRFAVFDPYSLYCSREWAKGRSVYLVSVSGATKSNVELAKALRGRARMTTAVTCNPSSLLARETDNLIEVPFRPRGKSPGIASFALTLLTLLRIGGATLECDFDGALSRAKKSSRNLHISSRGVTYLLGSNEYYAGSIYGAAKIYEFLGWRAHPTLFEEFSHMELFSLAKSDTVNLIAPEADLAGARTLSQALARSGYRSSLLSAGSSRGKRVELLYLLIFSLQLAAIDAATRREMKMPYFLSAPEKLKISDLMIYY